jgi:hypothetical protein
LYQETKIISILIPNKDVKDHLSDSVNMMIKTESLHLDMSRTRVMDDTTGWMYCTDNWMPLRDEYHKFRELCSGFIMITGGGSALNLQAVVAWLELSSSQTHRPESD